MRNHNIYHHIKGSQKKKENAQLNGFANMNFQKKKFGGKFAPPGINRVKQMMGEGEGGSLKKYHPMCTINSINLLRLQQHENKTSSHSHKYFLLF